MSTSSGNAKLSYVTNLGKKETTPTLLKKTYWKIINREKNKFRAPEIPPIQFFSFWLVE